MARETESTTREGSVVDPSYSSGDYFADARRHSTDARLKADSFLKLFVRFVKARNLSIDSFVDVGCGSGDIAKLIADFLHANGFASAQFKAYDVSPHVLNIQNKGVEYIKGDFCESDECVDVVTLFDVFEHVPGTIEFIRSISQKCRIMGFHIPLEYSLNTAARDHFRSRLQNPGHLVFMDTVAALNLLALSGLRVVDYEYTFGFRSAARSTLLSKITFPLKCLFAKISPWLLSMTFGGASLSVIAMTPHGLREDTRPE